MKKSILLITLLFLSLQARAQEILWPVSGCKAGENIIGRPQGYVGDEFNFSHLFIGCKDTDIIICPVDGTVGTYLGSYYHSLNYALSIGLDSSKTFDQWLQDEDLGSGVNKKYVSKQIGIKMADGRHLLIIGLKGDWQFKTGQRVSAGDTLGYAGYAYKAFSEPNITIELTRGGKPVDPMAPFGLETTFKEPEQIKRDDPISVEKAREDLAVLQEAIIDAYPSLDELMSREEFVRRMDSLKNTITRPLQLRGEFRGKLMQVCQIVHDSHIALLPDGLPAKEYDWRTPALYYISFGDTIKVLTSTEPFKEHIGKTVKSIDGVSAKDHLKEASKYIYGYDVNVRSSIDESLVMLYGAEEIMYIDKGPLKSSHVEFTDGSWAEIPYVTSSRNNGVLPGDNIRRMNMWYRIIRASKDDWFTEELNDSTAYLGLKTFFLDEVNVEGIRDYLGDCTKENLIIDLRNNNGGHVEVMNQLLSYLADKPLDKQKGGFSKVNSNTVYDSFKYCINYTNQMELFPDFHSKEGKDGFYSVEKPFVIYPDSLAHYSGKIYLLTNGASYSAATIFPSVLVRNRRGVTVGRETGTAYHFLTAEKFADIQLPNSMQTLRIPLIKAVFDTTVCERTPAGRGLLPDYPVPVTENEIMMGEDGQTDLILEYALGLIAQNKYLSDSDPFAEADSQLQRQSGKLWIYLFAAILLIILITVLATRHARAGTERIGGE